MVFWHASVQVVMPLAKASRPSSSLVKGDMQYPLSSASVWMVVEKPQNEGTTGDPEGCRCHLYEETSGGLRTSETTTVRWSSKHNKIQSEMNTYAVAG